ncbi:AMMECR1 family [Aspergillus sp. HF37]|nr:AMMECR1 family [Aspergillus sp. HF37]
MASPAQCYYCFECLSASFEGREPLSLAAVEELWEQHEQVKNLAAIENTEELGSLRGKVDQCQQIVDGEGTSVSKNYRPQNIKLPSISRLTSQPSSDSSSSSTTPSFQSSNSSHTALSNSTTVTTPTSNLSSGQQKPKYRQHPLFVTWNVLSKNGHKSLRGCIGTFETQELSAGLKSYALTSSAFDDTRFSPIPASLLPTLSCSLTLLGTFEPCTNAMDWVLGTHGLRISFIHRGRRYGATYLPDVPAEQGWSKEETVESLMRKAGWDGSTGSVARRLLRGSSSSSSHGSGSNNPWDQVSDFRAVKYQGLKASASYAQWQEWRNWVLSLEDGREVLFSPSR